jgi:phosphoribosylanthranilate isomerase
MKVKICGITSLDDALEAIEAGCDLLGFNFYPQSPRYLAPRDCSAIRSGMEQQNVRCISVGIFVNTPPMQILDVLDGCGLDLAQLAGDEPIEQLRELGVRGFKSIRPTSQAGALDLAARYAQPGCEPTLLVDAYQPGFYGGSGQTGDWALAGELAARYPLLLAGGLTPQNVALAAAQTRPWGVDVASGVESAPGKKDRSKMRLFIQAVRELENSSCPIELP